MALYDTYSNNVGKKLYSMPEAVVTTFGLDLLEQTTSYTNLDLKGLRWRLKFYDYILTNKLFTGLELESLKGLDRPQRLQTTLERYEQIKHV